MTREARFETMADRYTREELDATLARLASALGKPLGHYRTGGGVKRHLARQTSPEMKCGRCGKPIVLSSRTVKYGPGKVYSRQAVTMKHAKAV